MTLRLEMVTCHSNKGKPSCNSFSFPMKYNLDVQQGLKEIDILHFCFNLFYPSYWVVLPFSPWLWIVDISEGKLVGLGWGGTTNLSWKKRISQYNTKCCKITFIHITLFGTIWKLDNLYNSSDLNQQCWYFFLQWAIGRNTFFKCSLRGD